MDNGYDGECYEPKESGQGYGPKRRRHEVELEALENPTILANVGWQNLPQP